MWLPCKRSRLGCLGLNLSVSAMNVSVDRPTINTSVSGAHSSENRIEKDTFPIPDDVIIEIFSRLSVKVIARCRCVSKLWGSILRSKDFTDFFLIKSSARPQLLFLCRRLDRILFLSSHPPQNPDENSSPIDTSYDTSFPLNISQICRPIKRLDLCCISADALQRKERNSACNM